MSEALRPEVVKIGDLFHTQPTELGTTDGTCHVITGTVVHFDDECVTAWTRFDLIYTTSASQSHHMSNDLILNYFLTKNKAI